MKKISVLLLLSVSLAVSATTRLSESAKISLLTCEPSTAIYERFWHTAIRVYDEANNIDYAYNYGIFDFDTPFFIPKFIKGDTDYILAAYYTDDFTKNYLSRRSSIYEQVLNLSAEQRQALFDALEENATFENRTYRYNFVYDNCATRAYYIIKKILDASNQTMVVGYIHPTTTYRTVFEEFLGRDNWQRFAIDVVIGREADLPINTESLIAFPKYTMAMIGSTVLMTDTTSLPLVASTDIIGGYPPLTPSEHSPFRPTIVCSLLMIAVVFASFLSWRNGKYMAWLDFILFFVCGLVGLIVFYLSFLSSHPLVYPNYNLLWLNPLMLIFAFLLLNKRWRQWLSYLAAFNAITILLAIVVFVTRYQVMHASFLALMAMMLVRSLMFFKFQYKRKIQ